MACTTSSVKFFLEPIGINLFLYHVQDIVVASCYIQGIVPCPLSFLTALVTGVKASRVVGVPVLGKEVPVAPTDVLAAYPALHYGCRSAASLVTLGLEVAQVAFPHGNLDGSFFCPLHDLSPDERKHPRPGQISGVS